MPSKKIVKPKARRGYLSVRQRTHLVDTIRSLVAKNNKTCASQRAVSIYSAITVANRHLATTRKHAVDARMFGAIRAVNSFLSLATHAKFSSASREHTDLLPVGHPYSTRRHGLIASALRNERAQWIAADARIEEHLRPLVASVYSAARGTIERTYGIQLLTSHAKDLPTYIYTGEGDSITAGLLGLGGNSEGARRARVKLQRRDRLGRFAEMGGGFSFNVRLPGNNFRSVSGRIVGASSVGSADGIEIEVTGMADKGIPDGIYTVPSSKGRAVKAVLDSSTVEGLEDVGDSSSDAIDLGSPKQYPAGFTKTDTDPDGPATFETPDGYEVSMTGARDGLSTYKVTRQVGDTSVGEDYTSWADVQKAIVADSDSYNKYINSPEGQEALKSARQSADKTVKAEIETPTRKRPQEKENVNDVNADWDVTDSELRRRAANIADSRDGNFEEEAREQYNPDNSDDERKAYLAKVRQLKDTYFEKQFREMLDIRKGQRDKKRLDGTSPDAKDGVTDLVTGEEGKQLARAIERGEKVRFTYSDKERVFAPKRSYRNPKTGKTNVVGMLTTPEGEEERTFVFEKMQSVAPKKPEPVPMEQVPMDSILKKGNQGKRTPGTPRENWTTKVSSTSGGAPDAWTHTPPESSFGKDHQVTEKLQADGTSEFEVWRMRWNLPSEKEHKKIATVDRFDDADIAIKKDMPEVEAIKAKTADAPSRPTTPRYAMVKHENGKSYERELGKNYDLSEEELQKMAKEATGPYRPPADKEFGKWHKTSKGKWKEWDEGSDEVWQYRQDYQKRLNGEYSKLKRLQEAQKAGLFDPKADATSVDATPDVIDLNPAGMKLDEGKKFIADIAAKKQKVRFNYNGSERVVEPIEVWVNGQTGRINLRANDNGTKKNFSFDKIEAIVPAGPNVDTTDTGTDWPMSPEERAASKAASDNSFVDINNLEGDELRAAIDKAIADKKPLKFNYHEKERWVQPREVWTNPKNGKVNLRAIEAEEDEEKNFTLDKINKPLDVTKMSPEELNDAVDALWPSAAAPGGRRVIDAKNSTAVSRLEYDGETKTLFVQFVAKDGKGGGTYKYDGVEPEFVDRLETSGSIGKMIPELKRISTSEKIDEFPDAASVDEPLVWDGYMNTELPYSKRVERINSMDSGDLYNDVYEDLTSYINELNPGWQYLEDNYGVERSDYKYDRKDREYDYEQPNAADLHRAIEENITPEEARKYLLDVAQKERDELSAGEPGEPPTGGPVDPDEFQSKYNLPYPDSVTDENGNQVSRVTVDVVTEDASLEEIEADFAKKFPNGSMKVIRQAGTNGWPEVQYDVSPGDEEKLGKWYSGDLGPYNYAGDTEQQKPDFVSPEVALKVLEDGLKQANDFMNGMTNDDLDNLDDADSEALNKLDALLDSATESLESIDPVGSATNDLLFDAARADLGEIAELLSQSSNGDMQDAGFALKEAVDEFINLPQIDFGGGRADRASREPAQGPTENSKKIESVVVPKITQIKPGTLEKIEEGTYESDRFKIEKYLDELQSAGEEILGSEGFTEKFGRTVTSIKDDLEDNSRILASSPLNELARAKQLQADLAEAALEIPTNAPGKPEPTSPADRKLDDSLVEMFDEIYEVPPFAYKVNIFEEYEPKGRIDENSSQDYTDDPEVLSNMFTERELATGLMRAVLPSEDASDEAAGGTGELEFADGPELVPAEAIYSALERKGVDVESMLAKIYDSQLENSISPTSNLERVNERRADISKLDSVERNALPYTNDTKQAQRANANVASRADRLVSLIDSHVESNPKITEMADELKTRQQQDMGFDDLALEELLDKYLPLSQSDDPQDNEAFSAFWGMLFSLDGGFSDDPVTQETLTDSQAFRSRVFNALDKLGGGNDAQVMYQQLLDDFGTYPAFVQGKDDIADGLSDLDDPDNTAAAFTRLVRASAVTTDRPLWRSIGVMPGGALAKKYTTEGTKLSVDPRSYTTDDLTQNTPAALLKYPAEPGMRRVIFEVQAGDGKSVAADNFSWFAGENEHINDSGVYEIIAVRQVPQGSGKATADVVTLRLATPITQDGLDAEPDSLFDDTIIDVAGWRAVGGQLGSNPGGTYTDENGDQYYVKVARSQSHAENEVLAGAFYERLDVPAARTRLGDSNGETRIVSPMIDGATPDLRDKRSDPEYIKKLQDGFVVDAWLSNWDVVGLVYDNVVTDSSGGPVRVDHGGALTYRARGKAKGEVFNDEVNEIDTFRDPDLNPNSADIFGSITDEQIVEQVKQLAELDPGEIDSIVRSLISDKSEADKLSAQLIARQQYLTDRYLKDSSTEDIDLIGDTTVVTTTQPIPTKDLKPGDVTNDGSFVIEKVFTDESTPKGKMSVEGYYPGRVSQRKEWNADTNIDVARNGQVPPKGDGEALHRPTKPRAPSDGAFNGKMAELLAGAKTWDEAKQIIYSTEIVYFDYETTGFASADEPDNLNRPVQIGAVRVKNGKIVERMNLYMNPESPMGNFSKNNLKRMDGELLTDEWLSQQMSMADAHAEFVKFTGPNPILGGQYVPFDLEVLARTLREQGLELNVAGSIDSKDIASGTLPKYTKKSPEGPTKVNDKGELKASNSLGPIAEYLKVELNDWHRADADAEASWQVTDAMLTRAIDTNASVEMLDASALERQATEKAQYEQDFAVYKEALGKYTLDKAISAAWACNSATTASIGAEGPCAAPSVAEIIKAATPLESDRIDPEGVPLGSTSDPSSYVDEPELEINEVSSAETSESSAGGIDGADAALADLEQYGETEQTVNGLELKTLQKKQYDNHMSRVRQILEDVRSGKISAAEGSELIDQLAEGIVIKDNGKDDDNFLGVVKDVTGDIAKHLAGTINDDMGPNHPPKEMRDKGAGVSKDGEIVRVGTRVRDKWGFAGTVERYHVGNWRGVYIRMDIDPSRIYAPGAGIQQKNPNTVTVIKPGDDDSPYIKNFRGFSPSPEQQEKHDLAIADPGTKMAGPQLKEVNDAKKKAQRAEAKAAKEAEKEAAKAEKEKLKENKKLPKADAPKGASEKPEVDAKPIDDVGAFFSEIETEYKKPDGIGMADIDFDDDAMAFAHYRSGGARNINSSIMSGELGGINSPVARLDRFFDRAPLIDRDMLVYRGVNDKYTGADTFRTMQPGEVFVSPTFSSTSLLERVAADFATKGGGDGMIIEVVILKNNKIKGIYPDPFAGVEIVGDEYDEEYINGTEAELVLPRDMRYSVVSNDGKRMRVVALGTAAVVKADAPKGASEKPEWASLKPLSSQAQRDKYTRDIQKVYPKHINQVIVDYVDYNKHTNDLINSTLRGYSAYSANSYPFSKEDKVLADKYIADMGTVIDALPKIQKDTVVFRGSTNSFSEHFFETYKVGDVVAEDSFTSTSLDEEVALNFANTDEDEGIGLLLEIVAPAGTKGIVVPAYFGEDSEEEQEVILDRGTVLRIISMTDSQDEKTPRRVRLAIIDQDRSLNKNYPKTKTKTPSDIEKLEVPLEAPEAPEAPEPEVPFDESYVDTKPATPKYYKGLDTPIAALMHRYAGGDATLTKEEKETVYDELDESDGRSIRNEKVRVVADLQQFGDASDARKKMIKIAHSYDELRKAYERRIKDFERAADMDSSARDKLDSHESALNKVNKEIELLKNDYSHIANGNNAVTSFADVWAREIDFKDVSPTGVPAITVDSPPAWDAPGIDNTLSLAAAIETVNSSTPYAGIIGASTLVNSGSIEDLNVKVNAYIDENTNTGGVAVPVNSYTYKLTPWAGEKLTQSIIAKIDADAGSDKTAQTWASPTGKKYNLYKNDSLQPLGAGTSVNYKDDDGEIIEMLISRVIIKDGVGHTSVPGNYELELIKNGATVSNSQVGHMNEDKAKNVELYSFSNSAEGITYQHITADGIKVRVHRSVRDASYEVPHSKMGGPSAFNNMVQINAPKEVTPERIAEVMKEFGGVEDPRPTTKEDARVLAENRLLSVLGGDTDPYKNIADSAKRAATLAQIEKEHGITVDDLVFSATEQGNVKFRMSEEKAKALAKKLSTDYYVHSTDLDATRLPYSAEFNSFVTEIINDITQQQYDLGEQPYDIKQAVTQAVLLSSFLTGPRKGLTSTTRRWINGTGGWGSSSNQDVYTGGADYVFTTPRRSEWLAAREANYYGANFVIDPTKALTRLDFYANRQDEYGKRITSSNIVESAKILNEGRGSDNPYEVMFKDEISVEEMEFVQVGESMRQMTIRVLEYQGVREINGVPLEQFVVTKVPAKRRYSEVNTVLTQQLDAIEVLTQIDAALDESYDANETVPAKIAWEAPTDPKESLTPFKSIRAALSKYEKEYLGDYDGKVWGAAALKNDNAVTWLAPGIVADDPQRYRMTPIAIKNAYEAQSANGVVPQRRLIVQVEDITQEESKRVPAYYILHSGGAKNAIPYDPYVEELKKDDLEYIFSTIAYKDYVRFKGAYPTVKNEQVA